MLCVRAAVQTVGVGLALAAAVEEEEKVAVEAVEVGRR
jgi:hypothetical protein